MVFLWFLVFSVPTGMLMNKIGRRKTVILSLIVVAVIGLFFSYSSTAIFLFVALIGYGNSNIFPIMFSQALLHLPERNNEISGLMIMGLAGGAVFPLLMGGSFGCFKQPNRRCYRLNCLRGLSYFFISKNKKR